MLRGRLETAIDMNYIQFNNENDKKRRENEVGFIPIQILQNNQLEKIEMNKFFSMFQEKEEWRRSNKQLEDQLKEASTSDSGGFFDGILNFFGTVTSLFSIFK